VVAVSVPPAFVVQPVAVLEVVGEHGGDRRLGHREHEVVTVV
jgi:hypothetical protein